MTSHAVQFVPQVGLRGGNASAGYAGFSMSRWNATTTILVTKIEELITEDKMVDIVVASRNFITTSRTSVAVKTEECLDDNPLFLLCDDDDNGDDSEDEPEGKSSHSFLPSPVNDDF